MIEKMTRYDFILLKEESESFLNALQELGVVDIKRSVKAIDETSSALLLQADELRKRIAIIENEDFARDERHASLSSAIAAARKEAASRAVWGEFDADAIAKVEQAGCRMRFYALSKKKFDPEWANEYPLQVISEDSATVWFVTVAPAGEPYSFPVPEVSAPEGSAAESLARAEELEKELAAVEDGLREEKKELPRMKAEYARIVAEADRYFANAAAEGAVDNMVTVVTGFAPAQNDALLKEKFDAMELYYVSSDAAVDDNPPIKLRNNRFVSMFEVLTDMYGRPAYDGFDPTPYISIFFMLFFAMCMGDSGYGLVLVALGLALKKVKSFASLSPLVVTLGVATMVVGFFFHTFFSIDISTWGFIQDSGLSKVMVPSKIAGYDGTMIVAIIVGIIHLCLAMIVKTVYATKNKGFLGSLGTWGWTLFLVGSAAAVGATIAFHLDSAVIKWSIIILGGISAIGIFLLNDIHRNPLINVGAGLWETYNTATGVLGDVLSYLRLYALGLAGSMLGYAFNTLAVMALGDGGFGWLPFIIIALIGHVLNIAMAVLGAFVHPLRLNFLEFFKNSDYNGTGRNYNPLKK